MPQVLTNGRGAEEGEESRRNHHESRRKTTSDGLANATGTDNTERATHTHTSRTAHKQTPRASDTRATREEHAHNTPRQERKEKAGHRVRLLRTLTHGGTCVCEDAASNPA